MYLPQRFYSTDDIVHHSRRKTHFFDQDSKRFFNSRIGQNAYSTNNPFITLFTTSEKYENRYSHTSEPRYYTIRSYDYRTSDIETIGEFKEYSSSKQANRKAKEMAKNWEYTLEDQHEYALLLNDQFEYEKRKAICRNEGRFYVWEIRDKSFRVNT